MHLFSVMGEDKHAKAKVSGALGQRRERQARGALGLGTRGIPMSPAEAGAKAVRVAEDKELKCCRWEKRLRAQ